MKAFGFAAAISEAIKNPPKRVPMFVCYLYGDESMNLYGLTFC